MTTSELILIFALLAWMGFAFAIVMFLELRAQAPQQLADPRPPAAHQDAASA